MADVIGSLAYKLKLDSQEFKVGMAATRSEFAAAKAVARSASTGLDSYTQAARNLDTLLTKGLVNLAQHSAAKEKLTKEYLEQEAQVRRLTSAELAHLKTLRAASAGTRTTAQDEAERAKIMQRGREITEATRSSQDLLNRSLAEARKLYREGAISAGTYAKHVADIKKNAAGPGMLSGMGGFKGTIGAIGAAAGVGSLLSTGKDAIMMTANVERATAAMEAFTGSSAKAAAMLNDMRTLSSVAGISFLQLTEGAAAMMGYGISADVTSQKLRQFAEISRGDSERFRSMALAFGQVGAAGKLMGQELLQLINAGFNPLAEISRTTGIEFSTLKKTMEAGGISVDMVSKSFETATSQGGRFFNMLEANSKTSSGALGRLSAEWGKFLEEMGKLPATTQAADAASSSLSIVSEFFKGFAFNSKQGYMENIQSKMDRAQRADGKNLNDGGLFSTQTELSKAAQENNRLDAAIKNSPTYKEAQARERQRAQAKADNEARQKRMREEANKPKVAETPADRIRNDESSRKSRMMTPAEQQAEMQRQRQEAFMAQRRAMAERMSQALPGIEQRREQQIQAHSAVANISAGSQEAYKLMVAAQNRRDVNSDPQIKKMDQQIKKTEQLNASINKVTEAVNKVADKLDFEIVGNGR